MRIIGPNCIGVIRPTVNLNTSFLKASPDIGNVAFISQSGALGSAILDWAVRAHIGFSMFTSLGSTETAPSALSVTAKACAPGVVGIPNVGVEMKLVPSAGKLE